MTSSHGTEAAMEGRFPGASSAGNVNDSNSWTYRSPHAYVMIRVGRFVRSSSLRVSCFKSAGRPSSMTCQISLATGLNMTQGCRSSDAVGSSKSATPHGLKLERVNLRLELAKPQNWCKAHTVFRYVQNEIPTLTKQNIGTTVPRFSRPDLHHNQEDQPI